MATPLINVATVMLPVGMVLSASMTTPAESNVLPAPSIALAVIVCIPSLMVVELVAISHGAVVLDPISVPST